MTERQKKLFKNIVEFYIEIGKPIGSKNLLARYKLDLSSATVRSEMHALEESGFLEKDHVSSGRIPTTAGYKYFAQFLASSDKPSLVNKLEDLLAKRRMAIDFTIDEAASVISEIAGVTLAISSTSLQNDELMKSMTLTPVSSKTAVVVIVTSTGRVESKLFNFSPVIPIDDVKIAIRVFSERLIDTKLSDLAARVEALRPLLAEKIKSYEAVIQSFARNVFNFGESSTHKVYNNSEIIRSDIHREDLIKLLDLLEHKSVWESINQATPENEPLKIDVRPNNVALISRRFQLDHKTHEVSVVGSQRMNYSNAKQAIALVEKYLKMLKENNNE